jgi:hypothetical protein
MDATRIWIKDPDSTLTAGIWWQDVIERGDTLASVSWEVPTGLTKVSEGINVDAMIDSGITYPAGQVAMVRISGGTADTNYTITCTVTTTAGDIDERSITAAVRER